MALRLLRSVFLALRYFVSALPKTIETVAVVGSDDDLGVFELADLREVSDGSFDGIIEFEEFAESAIVVKSMHLLINGRSFGHQEPPSVVIRLSTIFEDVDSLQRHLLETGLVNGVATLAVWSIFIAMDILRIDVTVEPSDWSAAVMSVACKGRPTT